MGFCDYFPAICSIFGSSDDNGVIPPDKWLVLKDYIDMIDQLRKIEQTVGRMDDVQRSASMLATNHPETLAALAHVMCEVGAAKQATYLASNLADLKSGEIRTEIADPSVRANVTDLVRNLKNPTLVKQH